MEWRAQEVPGWPVSSGAQLQEVPFRVKAEGEVSLLVNVPVKPTVAVEPGGMAAL